MPTGLRSKKLKVDIYFTTGASQTWAVSVYASGTRLALSTDSSGASTLPAGTTGKYTTYFDATTASSYTVNLTRTAGSGTAVLIYTGIIVGPGIQPQGAVVSDWMSYTPTGSLSTNATYTGKWRRVGDSMSVSARIAFSGATDAATAFTINIPSGYTIDTSKLLGTGALSQSIGQGLLYDDNTTVSYFCDVVYNSTTSVRFRLLSAGGTFAQEDNNVTAATPITIANLDHIECDVIIPISEWAGSGTVNVAQNDVEYASSTTGTWDAAASAGDTVYGPGGSVISGTLTAARNKVVRLVRPLQQTDRLVLELLLDSTNDTWIEVQNSYVVSVSTASFNFGAQITAISGTDVTVTFNQYAIQGSTFNSATGAVSWGVGGYYTAWRIKKVSSGVAVGFGLADTLGNSGLVNPYSSSGAGVVYSGTWTPTFSGAVNMATPTVLGSQYMRVGKMVQCTLRLNIDPTADNTATEVEFTPPISSNFTSAYDATGVGQDTSYDGTNQNLGMRVYANSATDKLGYAFTTRDTAAADHFIVFMYEIK
jgi:hypothetical protein